MRLTWMDSVCAIRMDVFIGARTQYVPGARHSGARVRGRGRGDGKRHVYRVWARQRRRARDECRVRSASGSCTTWLFHQIRVEPKIAVRKIKNKVDSFSQAASNVPTSLSPRLSSLRFLRRDRRALTHHELRGEALCFLGCAPGIRRWRRRVKRRAL